MRKFAGRDARRQPLGKVRDRRLAIGRDEVAKRGEKRDMRQHIRLDAGAERILPDRRKPLVRLALLQRQLFAFRMLAFAHDFPRLHTLFARLPRVPRRAQFHCERIINPGRYWL